MAYLDYDGLGYFKGKLDGEIYPAYVTPTESGDIASFPDGADEVPMKRLVVNVEPVQDLHGYEYPWPVGGSKNMLPITVNSIKAKNAHTSWTGNSCTINGVTFTIVTDSDGNVTGIRANGTNTGNFSTTYIDIYDFGASLNGKTVICSCASTSPSLLRIIGYAGLLFVRTGTSATVTVPNDATSALLRVCVEPGTCSNDMVYPMVRLSTVADDTFVPPSNICPISGWTEANGVRCGINIWDGSYTAGKAIVAANGSVNNVLDNVSASDYIPVAPSTQYYFNTYHIGSGSLGLAWYDASKQYISGYVFSGGSSALVGALTSPATATYVRFTLLTANVGTASVNYPSTDHDYHAYDGTTIQISFPSSAGTVYGGTLNVTSGELTVDKAIKTYDGSGNCYNIAQRTNTTRFSQSAPGLPSVAAVTPVISDSLKFDSTFSIYDTDIYGISTWNGAMWFSISSEAGNTSTSINAYLSNNPITAVYPLATPVEYQLTPTQVTTLLGTNNVWFDCGSTDCTYRADAALYIDKELAEMQALILENI